MTSIRRIGTILAPAMGLVLLAASASATTITVTTSVFGNVPGATAPASGLNSSAAQFNATATNAAIQSACPVGHTCSALTLTEVDFNITANINASLGVSNTTGSTQYIGAFVAGTFGSPTSGTAISEVANLHLNDSITTNLAIAIPTFSVATNVQRKKACSSGTASAGNFSDCLSVATGSTTFSGTGSDTGQGSYLNTDGNWSSVLAAYVGTGSVSFTLSLDGTSNNGSLPAGVTIPTNSATLTALTNGLEVDYLYSYTDTVNPTGAPEPSTMVFAGSALLLAGIARRRRQSN